MSIDVCFENPASFEPSVRPQNIFRNIRGNDWRGTVLIYPFPEQTVAPDRPQDLRRRRPRVLQTPGRRHDRHGRLGRDPRPGLAPSPRRPHPHRLPHLGVPGRRPLGHPPVRRLCRGLCSRSACTFRPEWAINIHKAGPHIKEDGDHRPGDPPDPRGQGDRLGLRGRPPGLPPDGGAPGARRPRPARTARSPGFDGLEPPQGLRRLASIRVPHEDIGASAVARLLSRIVHPNAPRRKILVEGLLVEGETVGPPPKR
jgi:LacI family transcriptional regulator